MKLRQLLFIGIVFLIQAILLYNAVHKDPPFMDIDSQAYTKWGAIFAADTSFSGCAVLPAHGLGYPFFVGIIYKLFGKKSEPIIYTQIIISIFICMLVAYLGSLIFGQKVGFIAGLCASFNVGYITFSHFILTEIFLALLLILASVCIVYSLVKKRILWLLVGSFFLGLSIVVKPAGLYFLPFLMPLVWFFVQEKKLYKKITVCCAVSIFFILPIMGLLVHNRLVFGQFRLGNIQEVNLYFWLLPNILAHINNSSSDSERVLLQEMVRSTGNYSLVRTLFIKCVKSNSITVVIVLLKNAAKTLFGLYSTNLKVLIEPKIYGGDVSFFKATGSLYHKFITYLFSGVTHVWLGYVALLEFFWTVMRIFFIWLGVVCLLKQRKYALVYFIGAYCAYFTAVTSHDGCARFRMMQEHWFIVLAAYGIYFLLRSLNFLKNEKILS